MEEVSLKLGRTEWHWNHTMNVHLMATDDEADCQLFQTREQTHWWDVRDNIHIGVYERNPLGTDTLLGIAVVGSAQCLDCQKEGAIWLQLHQDTKRDQMGTQCGEHSTNSRACSEIQIWHEVTFNADHGAWDTDVDVSWMDEPLEAVEAVSPRSKLQYSPKHHWGHLNADVDREVAADFMASHDEQIVRSPRPAPALGGMSLSPRHSKKV